MARNEADESRSRHRQAALDALDNADAVSSNKDYGPEERAAVDYFLRVAQVEATLAVSAGDVPW